MDRAIHILRPCSARSLATTGEKHRRSLASSSNKQHDPFPAPSWSPILRRETFDLKRFSASAMSSLGTAPTSAGIRRRRPSGEFLTETALTCRSPPPRNLLSQPSHFLRANCGQLVAALTKIPCTINQTWLWTGIAPARAKGRPVGGAGAVGSSHSLILGHLGRFGLIRCGQAAGKRHPRCASLSPRSKLHHRGRGTEILTPSDL